MMTSWRLSARIALFGVFAAVTALAALAVYNRYFDESGGMFCETRDTEIDMPNKQICIYTGVDLDVIDPRYSGALSMILIKYREGLLYDCFWFDDRAFTYSAGGWKPGLFEHCSKGPRDFEMRKKTLK
jgi:hypothetical protein